MKDLSVEQLRAQIYQKQSMIALLELGLSHEGKGEPGRKREQLTRGLIEIYRGEIEECKARIAELEQGQ